MSGCINVNYELLHEGREQDSSWIANMFASAFELDPMFDYLIRDDHERKIALVVFFEELLKSVALGRGRVVARIDKTACAVWMPPGDPGIDLPILKQIRLFPKILRVCSLQRLHRFFYLTPTLKSYHPSDQDYWYLLILGVDPKHQGLGIGTDIMNEHLSLGRIQDETIFLETANKRSIAFYQRFGFRLTEEISLPYSGPKAWFLRRN